MSKDKDQEGRRLRLIESDASASDKREAEAEAASRALVAALRPSPLDEVDHEALLALTLGDEVVDIPAEERRAAEHLRLALEGVEAHPLAELATSLRCCREPAATLDEEHNEQLIAAALRQELVVAEPERRQAERLMLALQGSGQHELADFADTLRLAHREARPLTVADNEAMLALTLGDAASSFNEAELDAADELRRALGSDGDDHPLVQLACSLRAATATAELDELSVERAVARAMGSKAEPRRARRPAARVMLMSSIAAVAAGLMMLFGSMAILETTSGPSARRDKEPTAPRAVMVEARSTQALFDPTTRFATKGGESERLGKIVAARAADLRANRFAAWGVK